MLLRALPLILATAVAVPSIALSQGAVGAAGRTVWLAAVWTGAGTAVLGAMIAIVAVALCWLPASHGSGNATSALKAGLLTLLAAVHGGITVNGTDAAFLPLGLTVLLGIALMTLIFLSNRSGHDADAGAPHSESDE